MKSKAIVSAITVAALSFGSLSFAQGSYDRRGPGNYEPQRVYDQRGPQQRVDTNYNDRRDNDYGARRFDNNPRGFYDDHRDARNDRNYDARGPQFRRGGYILREYRSNPSTWSTTGAGSNCMRPRAGSRGCRWGRTTRSSPLPRA